MKQESKRLSSIILAALLILGALMVYFELITPAYANLETIKGQVESEKTLYANEAQIVTQVKGLLATYQSNSSSSQLVAMALPVGPDVSGALAQIYGIGENTGVTVANTNVSVEAVAPAAAGSGSSGSTIAGAAAAGSIINPTGTVSFQISGSGSYESIKDFIEGLETNIRIFDVSSISLQPAPIAATKTQAGDPDMFNYSMTAVTYYQSP